MIVNYIFALFDVQDKDGTGKNRTCKQEHTQQKYQKRKGRGMVRTECLLSLWSVQVQNDFTLCSLKRDPEKPPGSRGVSGRRGKDSITLFIGALNLGWAGKPQPRWWQSACRGSPSITEAGETDLGQNASFRWFRSSIFQLQAWCRRTCIFVVLLTNVCGVLLYARYFGVTL